jgi:hypothetical protein
LLFRSAAVSVLGAVFWTAAAAASCFKEKTGRLGCSSSFFPDLLMDVRYSSKQIKTNHCHRYACLLQMVRLWCSQEAVVE